MEILLIIGLVSLLFGGSNKKNKQNWSDRWHEGEKKRYWNYGSMEDSQRHNSSFWG